MPARYFRSGYLSDIARLPVLDDSYFRNNADLGTGLLMANSAITSPHFFAPRPSDWTAFLLYSAIGSIPDAISAS